MKSCFVFFTLFLASYYSFAGKVVGEGRFYSKKEDGSSLIKKELMASAIKDMMTKELKKMKLDHDAFWKKYDASFEEHFGPIKDALKKRYKDGEPKQTAKQKSNLVKVLRHRRLSEKRKYGKLRKIVQSYSVSKFSRSPQYPQARFMSVKAKVNRKRLFDIYSRYMSNASSQSFEKLYLSIEYSLGKENWSILDVDSESDFTSAVEKEWMNWLQNKSALKLSSYEMAKGSDLEQLKIHLKIDKQALEGLSKEGGSSNYRSALWVRLKFDIKLIKDEPLFKTREFKVSGEMVTYDLNSNSAISFASFPSTKVIFDQSLRTNLASQMASKIYQFPIAQLSKLPSALQGSASNVSYRKIELENVRSIKEVFALNQLIMSKGVTVRARALGESLSQGKASIGLTFQGSSEELSKLLLGLSRAKVNQSRYINFPQEGNPFLMRLK